jgi:hypothetical protein
VAGAHDADRSGSGTPSVLSVDGRADGGRDLADPVHRDLVRAYLGGEQRQREQGWCS